MGAGRRRLTPLSGELQEMVYGPAEPVGGRRREEREQKALPTTRLGVLKHGLRRFLVIAAALAGATALAALLIVWLADASPARTFPRAFYFAGAFLGAVAVFGGMGTFNRQLPARSERELTVSRSFVYAAFAVVLIVIGVTLEFLL